MVNLVKTQEELKIMREAGRILGEIVDILSKEVVEGNTVLEVDKYANFLCKRFNVKPAFLGYGGFKGTICANLNEVIVHGVPSTVNTKFKKGDIFGLDMGVIYRGYYSDMSVTIGVGELDPGVKKFVDKTYQSMMGGIVVAKAGNTVGDITEGMRKGLIDDKFVLVRDFIGHGIGRNLHEKPDIPGIGLKSGEGLILEEGMVLAIESISVYGNSIEYEIDRNDKWTVYTKGKGLLSGLFEHTVIVTKDGGEIITKA